MTVHDYPNFYFGQWNGWKAYFNQRTNNTFWTLRHFHRDMEGIDLEAPLLLRFSAIYISYIYIHIYPQCCSLMSPKLQQICIDFKRLGTACDWQQPTRKMEPTAFRAADWNLWMFVGVVHWFRLSLELLRTPKKEYGCLHKWGAPLNHPFIDGNSIAIQLLGYHHFRKPQHYKNNIPLKERTKIE